MQVAHALVALALAAGAAQENEASTGTSPRSLVVTGDALVSARPDRAVVNLGATAQQSSADAAQQQVNGVMQRALEALQALGLPEWSIQTTGISLYPVYPDRRPQPADGEETVPRIVGYRASNTIRVEVDDVELLGKVIDTGIASGANELHGISFELQDDTEQRAQALRQATLNARHKAAALAEAAGVRLVSLQRIQEGGVETLAPVHRGVQTARLEASTPVQPGQVRVNASVTLTYDIAPEEAKAGTR